MRDQAPENYGEARVGIGRRLHQLLRRVVIDSRKCRCIGEAKNAVLEAAIEMTAKHANPDLAGGGYGLACHMGIRRGARRTVGPRQFNASSGKNLTRFSGCPYQNRSGS